MPLMAARDEAGWFLFLLFKLYSLTLPGEPLAFSCCRVAWFGSQSQWFYRGCHRGLAFDVSVCVHSCFWPHSLVSCLPTKNARRYNSIGVCLLTVHLLTMSNYSDYQFYKQGEKNFKVIQHMKNLKSFNNWNWPYVLTQVLSILMNALLCACVSLRLSIIEFPE